MIDIICPSCNLAKTVPREKIPKGVKWVRCPKCSQRFELPFLNEATENQSTKGVADTPFNGPTNITDSPSTGHEEPAPSGQETKQERTRSPWEERDELGAVQGIWKTFKETLFSPIDFFRTVPHNTGFKEPLAYGLLMGSIGTMFGFFWQFLMIWGGMISAGEELLSLIGMPAIFFGILVISPIFVLIGIFFTSAVLHVCLLIVRGGGNGFEGTLRVVSYSQSAQIFSIVPFAGGVIAGIWQLIVEIIGVKEIHETSYLKVVLALLIPFFAILLLIVAILVPVLILT